MTIEWVSPDAGLLLTVLELTEGDPVYTIDFVAEYVIEDELVGLSATQNTIEFEFRTNNIIQFYTLESTGDFQATYTITPIVRELDYYIPGYEQPPGFSYDAEATAGKNYATFGSDLYNGYVSTFVVRAFNPEAPEEFEDRTFVIDVQNNWSSSRDSFILRYYENEKLVYNDEEYTPENYLIKLKQDGYFD